MVKNNMSFVKVKCGKCKNEQTIFTTTSNVIECLICSEALAIPTGGKAVISAEVIETY
jgi:small subunit ribosomal protein S27e